MEQQMQTDDRLDGMWHCKACGKWLGVISNGQLVMAHGGRSSRIRGEIEVKCERCETLNRLATNA